MTQAIVTKYMGATNYKPGRVKATCEARSVTLSYDHGLSTYENHRAAMAELCRVMGWQEMRYSGALPKQNKWDYVFCDDKAYP